METHHRLQIFKLEPILQIPLHSLLMTNRDQVEKRPCHRVLHTRLNPAPCHRALLANLHQVLIQLRIHQSYQKQILSHFHPRVLLLFQAHHRALVTIQTRQNPKIVCSSWILSNQLMISVKHPGLPIKALLTLPLMTPCHTIPTVILQKLVQI